MKVDSDERGKTLIKLEIVDEKGVSDAVNDGRIWVVLTEAAYAADELLREFRGAVFARYAEDSVNDVIQNSTLEEQKMPGSVVTSIRLRNVRGETGHGISAPINFPWFVRVDDDP